MKHPIRFLRHNKLYDLVASKQPLNVAINDKLYIAIYPNEIMILKPGSLICFLDNKESCLGIIETKCENTPPGTLDVQLIRCFKERKKPKYIINVPEICIQALLCPISNCAYQLRLRFNAYNGIIQKRIIRESNDLEELQSIMEDLNDLSETYDAKYYYSIVPVQKLKEH